MIKKLFITIGGIYILYSLVWLYRFFRYSQISKVGDILVMLIYFLAVLTIFIILSIPGIIGLLFGIGLLSKDDKTIKIKFAGVILSTVSFLWIYLCLVPPFGIKLPAWGFLYDIVGKKISDLFL